MKIPGGDVLSFSQHCHSMSPTSYQVWIVVARGRDFAYESGEDARRLA